MKIEKEGIEFEVLAWEGQDLDGYWAGPMAELEKHLAFYFLPGAPEPATLKEYEDKVLATLDQLTDLEKWIAFKYLYTTGMRASEADSKIKKLLKDKA